jgi:hypothetical protein
MTNGGPTPLPVPIAGEQRVAYTPVLPAPPEWWAEARISLDDVEPLAAAPTAVGS